MECAVEVPLPRGGETLTVEEDPLLGRKIDLRGDLIRLLGPVREIHVAGDRRARAVPREIHVVEVDDAVVDREPRLHVDAELFVRLDLDGPVRETGASDIGGRDRRAIQLDIQVGRRGRPRRDVIVVGERPAQRHHAPQRGGEAARPLAGGLAAELREVVAAVGVRLDHHVPVGHGDRFDDQLLAEDRPPRHLDGDRLGREERPVLRGQPFDHQVLDHEHAGREPRRQAADVHRALDELGPSVSARLRRDGPRSMVNTAMNTATTIATSTTMISRSARNVDRIRLRGRPATGSTVGSGEASPGGCPSGRGAGGSSGWSAISATRTYSTTTSTRPASTDMPSVTGTSLTRPAFGDRSSFSIFIASTTTTGWRAATSSPGATRI